MAAQDQAPASAACPLGRTSPGLVCRRTLDKRGRVTVTYYDFCHCGWHIDTRSQREMRAAQDAHYGRNYNTRST